MKAGGDVGTSAIHLGGLKREIWVSFNEHSTRYKYKHILGEEQSENRIYPYSIHPLYSGFE